MVAALVVAAWAVLGEAPVNAGGRVPALL
jgi:hypothetical protein